LPSGPPLPWAGFPICPNRWGSGFLFRPTSLQSCHQTGAALGRQPVFARRLRRTSPPSCRSGRGRRWREAVDLTQSRQRSLNCRVLRFQMCDRIGQPPSRFRSCRDRLRRLPRRFYNSLSTPRPTRVLTRMCAANVRSQPRPAGRSLRAKWTLQFLLEHL
jgi:hypothetical protein